MLKKVTFAAALCAMVIPFAAVAASPSGFTQSPASARAPQGFQLETMQSIADLKKNARDDQVVKLVGRFTSQLSMEKYEFTDSKGDKVVAELDDDKNWSHIQKDALVEITAEVDKDFTSLKLDVIDARPVK